jgi:hypothetical protein
LRRGVRLREHRRGLHRGAPQSSAVRFLALTARRQDALLTSVFRTRLAHRTNELAATVNGVEQAATYAEQMHRFVTSSDALERAEDRAKLKSCADGLLDVAAKFAQVRGLGAPGRRRR